MSVTVDAPVDGELYLYHEITRLNRELEQLTKRVEAIEGDPSQPEECRNKTCTFYTHYLVYDGPPDLVHEGYHAAEKRCLEVQALYQKAMDEGEPEDVLNRYERVCEVWEKRIRA